MVNTFLPYPSFTRSVRVLDRPRLGKQRTEVTWILKALRTGEGYIHHPATKMWQGYEVALAMYGLAACDEWTRRGYRDTLGEQIRDTLPWPTIHTLPSLQALKRADRLPWWFGWRLFHESHRSNLVRKDDDHYTFDIRPDLPYVWPFAERNTWKTQHSKDSIYFVRNPIKTWTREYSSTPPTSRSQ